MAERNISDVQQMAQLYQKAPVREMVKRGLIRPELGAQELTGELEAFFESDLQTRYSIPCVATKRTVTLDYLNPAEMAWRFGKTPRKDANR